MTSHKLKVHLTAISRTEKTASGSIYFYFSDCDFSNGWIDKKLSEVLSEYNLHISHVHTSAQGKRFIRCNLADGGVVTFVV